jgi:CheY-like chemotaxis protein
VKCRKPSYSAILALKRERTPLALFGLAARLLLMSIAGRTPTGKSDWHRFPQWLQWSILIVLTETKRLSMANEIPQPLHVYIVEDSPIIQRLLASAIEAAGAETVGYSAEAQPAIAALFALQPDLILIDIGLVTGSGFDVLKALQENSLVPGAIKVVLTNHANAEYRNLSFRFGADRFFDKSSETSQALALINTLAAERGRTRVSPTRSSTTRPAS